MLQDVTYHPVPPELQRYVATLHRGYLKSDRPVRLPALLAQIWFCASPLWWVPPGAREPSLLPAVTLLGFTSQAFEVLPERDSAVIGIGLWPLGWAELVQKPAYTMTDQALDASVFWPELCRQWHTDARQADDLAAIWGPALERFARALALNARASTDADRIARIDTWLNTEETPVQLARRLCLSARQTERVTARTHGGSPRLIAGKWRTLRAAAEMEQAMAKGANVWARYSDQSHFIREFRRFIGITPQPYQREETLAKRILADPWHTTSTHPLALLRATERRSSGAEV